LCLRKTTGEKFLGAVRGVIEGIIVGGAVGAAGAGIYCAYFGVGFMAALEITAIQYYICAVTGIIGVLGLFGITISNEY